VALLVILTSRSMSFRGKSLRVITVPAIGTKSGDLSGEVLAVIEVQELWGNQVR
jgi:hypothetical protein